MKYLLRAIKYFLSLTLLYVVAVSIFSALGLSLLTPAESFQIMVSTDRGLIMIAMVVALSALYPRFGFIKRRLKGDTKRHREAIISAFALSGFALKSEGEGEMIFGGENLQRRLTMIFDDEITLKQVGEELEIEGIRRGVSYVAYRLASKIDLLEE
ncbi:MAG: hypothetical protein SNH88_05650 [Rikenellaceae bacterium]